MLFSQTLLNGWITWTHYSCGTQIFQKPSCQKSDIEEAHHMNCRHCLSVLAHKIWKYLKYRCHLTQCCLWLPSIGTLQRHSLYVFWSLYTLKSCTHWNPDCYYGSKQEVLCVPSSVVKYEKYVHIKACPAWGQVKMTLIPAPGKANCTEAMGYHPISLLFCMQKIMQKLVARHIRDKSLGLCPCTAIPICLQTRNSTEMAMHHVISHTQEAVENRLSYIWAFRDTEGASDSNSCDTERLPHQMGLETHCSNGVALCWVAEKLQSSSQGRNAGGICGQGPSTERHFINPQVLPGCRHSHRETWWEWMLYCAVMHYHQLKIPDYCHRASSGGFEYWTVVW